MGKEYIVVLYNFDFSLKSLVKENVICVFFIYLDEYFFSFMYKEVLIIFLINVLIWKWGFCDSIFEFYSL